MAVVISPVDYMGRLYGVIVIPMSFIWITLPGYGKNVRIVQHYKCPPFIENSELAKIVVAIKVLTAFIGLLHLYIRLQNYMRVFLTQGLN
jgi:hypothetical protein